jgi:hypothetical protein
VYWTLGAGARLIAVFQLLLLAGLSSQVRLLASTAPRLQQKNPHQKAGCEATIEARTWAEFPWATLGSPRSSAVRELFYAGSDADGKLNFICASVFVMKFGLVLISRPEWNSIDLTLNE